VDLEVTRDFLIVDRCDLFRKPCYDAVVGCGCLWFGKIGLGCQEKEESLEKRDPRDCRGVAAAI
jgi:hypothetical protein